MRALPLLLVALIVSVPSSRAAPLAAPALSAGDFFETRDTITEPSVATQARTYRETVEALEPVTVGNATYDAVRLSTSLGTTWIRASDGARLRERSGSGADATETTYDPPCEMLRFPLAVGDSWTSACNATTTRANVPAYASITTTSYRALREEDVTVPAGAFHAIAIESTGQGPQAEEGVVRLWYAPAACHVVKTLASSHDGYADAYELMAYRCAAAGASGPAKRGVPAAPAAWIVAAAAVAVGMRRRR